MDFKIAVCDDEAYFRDRIKELCRNISKRMDVLFQLTCMIVVLPFAVIRIILKRMMSYFWTLAWMPFCGKEERMG